MSLCLLESCSDIITSPLHSPTGGEGMTADEDGGHRERILEESTLFRGADRMKLIHAIIQYHGPGTA